MTFAFAAKSREHPVAEVEIRKSLSIVLTVGLAATTATGALAEAPSNKSKAQATPALEASLEQMTTAEVQRLKTINGDRDQGDENASPRAKEVVCFKSNPASQRSAICDKSPN
jgi:hypothetical protein